MLTVNILYTGRDGSALRFAREMEESGLADGIRKEPGCLRYEYFTPLRGSESVLLIDVWESQEALDAHHKSAMMQDIIRLREKHDLHMEVMRYAELPGQDDEFIRK